MKDTVMEKKQLTIFLLIAYGITYLMGFVMWYGYGKGADVSTFANVQMMYPAAGVILAFLLTGEKRDRLPRLFFGGYLVITGILMVLAVLSVVYPEAGQEAFAGAGLENGISLWLLLVQLVLIGGSILEWIFLLAAGKDRRRVFGLQGMKWKPSVLCILLFLGLYLLRTLISCLVSGQMAVFGLIWTSPVTWIQLAALPVNFFLVFLAFFGEEYGWRYYFQPLLQKKFGPRWGVLLLGVVWGLWHMPLNLLYYSPDAGLVSMAAQQITCITLGIFFAYAYGKTGNIWVPVALHFMNNNLIPVITGNYSADVLQNQAIAWGDLVPALLLNGLVFGPFLFSKVFQNCDQITEIK